MALSRELMENYTQILKEELIPAMGCTEPIAIAYAAAVARKILGEDPVRVAVNCSGNMIKNVKGVTVPNSGGLKGIDAAALLGIVGGDPEKALEVIAKVTDAERAKTAEIVKKHICDVSLVENVPNLYIQILLTGEHHTSEVVISKRHTNLAVLKRDGKDCGTCQEGEASHSLDQVKEEKEDNERRKMTLMDLLEYADTVDLDDVRDVLERQIAFNSAIAQEGLDNAWGAGVGKTIVEQWGGNVKELACAMAAAGSDARMSGCPLPVVINSGSGNQGITVTMPVVVYAKEWHVSHDKMLRSLLVSNLVSIYIKHYIGALSAFCGAVSAACGAGAAVTYMSGGDYSHIGKTITNALCNVGGIVCDGAKPSCAAKIAASVHAALLGHYMSMGGRQFEAGEGLVEEDVEQTIKNMGYVGKVGMKGTDHEILNVMIDKVDVDSSL